MNSNLKKSIYQDINRYLNSGCQLTSALESAFTTTAQPFRITTCGLLKAGKSSLLNALTNNFEKELFATGAVRTTVQNQTLLYQNFIFVDTPGLDANEEDDKEAWSALDTADMLLFVHDPGIGELHNSEIEFLLELASQSGSGQSLNNRLVIILTRLDSNEEFIDIIAKKILSQIKNFLEIEPLIFQVSLTSHQKGKLQNKQKLIEYSRVLVLQKYIFNNLTQKCSNFDILRLERIDQNQKKLIDAIDAEIVKREKQINIADIEINKINKDLDKDLYILINTLRAKIFAYENTY